MGKGVDGYSEPVWLDVDQIDPRPASEIRLASDADAVASYAENFGQLPPLKVICDPSNHHWLADGRHRLDAAHRLGKQTVLCLVKAGTYVDAFGEASKANDTHGVRVTNADKRHRVEVALKHPEMRGWSVRRIADHCGVSDRFVGNLRPNPTANGSQLGEPTKTIGKDGKARSVPKRKPKTSKPPVESDPEPDDTVDDQPDYENESQETTGQEDRSPVQQTIANNGVQNPPTENPPSESAPVSGQLEPEPVSDSPPSQSKVDGTCPFDCDARWDQFEAAIRYEFNSWPLDSRGFFAMQMESLATELVMSCPDIRVHNNVSIPFKDRA